MALSLLNWKRVAFGKDENTEEYIAKDMRFLYRAVRIRSSKSYQYRDETQRHRKAPLRVTYYVLHVADLKTMNSVNLHHHMMYTNTIEFHPNPLYAEDREPHHLDLTTDRFLPALLVDGNVKLYANRWMTTEDILNEMEQYLDAYGYLSTLRKGV